MKLLSVLLWFGRTYKSITRMCVMGEARGKRKEKNASDITHDLLHWPSWLAQCGVTHVPWIDE